MKCSCLSARDGLVDEAEKLEPLLMAMTLLAQAKDLAVGRIQRGKQGGGAVAFVVVGHGAAAPPLQGQAGLGTIQSLNLALLVHAQHQRVLGRIQVQADDVFQFLGKMRIVADLEGFDPMRFQPWARQMRRTLASLMPTAEPWCACSSGWR